VRRDDELASLAPHRVEQRNEAEARAERKRSLRFVEEVHADVGEAVPQDQRNDSPWDCLWSRSPPHALACLGSSSIDAK
jgi:hypothetical protein